VKFKLSCEVCGDLGFVHVDGYDVAERLLEGVIFKIYPDGHAECRKEDLHYFEQFNQEMWLKEVEEFVDEADGGAVCPKCKVEADVAPL
jgi:hypothetical protein